MSEQKYCTVCAKNGVPNVPIQFQKDGWDASQNKQKWKLLNMDGSDHKHTSKGNEGSSAPQSSPKPPNLPIDEVMEVEKNVNTMLQAGWTYLNSFWNPTNGAVTYIIGRKKP